MFDLKNENMRRQCVREESGVLMREKEFSGCYLEEYENHISY